MCGVAFAFVALLVPAHNELGGINVPLHLSSVQSFVQAKCKYNINHITTRSFKRNSRFEQVSGRAAQLLYCHDDDDDDDDSAMENDINYIFNSTLRYKVMPLTIFVTRIIISLNFVRRFRGLFN